MMPFGVSLVLNQRVVLLLAFLLPLTPAGCVFLPVEGDDCIETHTLHCCIFLKEKWERGGGEGRPRIRLCLALEEVGGYGGSEKSWARGQHQLPSSPRF